MYVHHYDGMMKLFKHFVLDKASPVPLHYQLARAIASLIESGELEANAPLPNENDLCKQFNISRSTVRRTFGELLATGLVYRPRARGVLHVAPKRIHQTLGRLRGFFTDDMLTAGLTPSCKVMSCSVVPHPAIAERFGLPLDTMFYRIQRIHEGNGQPITLQISFIPRSVVAELTPEMAARSLLEIIEANYSSPISRAVQKIKVRTPTTGERKLLELTGTVHVFNVERVTYAEDNQVVEYFTCVLPADRFDFTMDLSVSDRWSTSGTELGLPLGQLMTIMTP